MGWRKAWATAAMAGVLASGVLWAQSPESVVVIREPGKPEHRCVIESAHPQANGHVIYDVRDLATGERLRVVDTRSNKSTGPFASPSVTRMPGPSDAGMSSALTGTPFANAGNAARSSTPAAQASGSKPSGIALTGMFKTDDAAKGVPAAVQSQIQNLKSASTPAQRELAAMTLTISDACTSRSVVQAISQAACTDAEASVRACCVLCLYRLSSVSPDAAPVIETLTRDPNPEVAALARKAMDEIARRSAK